MNKKYKLHSLTKKVLADIYTPVSMYAKLRDHYPNAFLLESADYHDRSDSRSYICLEPYAGFEATSNTYSYQLPNEKNLTHSLDDKRLVFTALQEFMQHFTVDVDDSPFNTHGLWGYSSFESVEYMEDLELGTTRSDLKENPDLKYQLFRYVLVFDHFKNELYITQHDTAVIEDYSDINNIIKIIKSNEFSEFEFYTHGEESSNLTDEEYRNIVTQGIKHCKLGDTFQVVLSRSFQQKYSGDDFKLYRHLRSLSPSPYLFYFDYGSFKIMGSSPESQLQVANGIAQINPIAGTVKRGTNAEEDKQLAEHLSLDEKEKAEHVMLVDLARNDLSKNSHLVTIDRYAEIQSFSHVIHMVSQVSGKLFEGVSGLDVYRDTFPAGTLSGAPKYRAMEIIGNLEKNSRNFYGGAIGFLGFDGTVNHAIIIRSILCKNNTLVYQAGAGVVSASQAENELQEVYNKTAAIRNAISKAQSL